MRSERIQENNLASVEWDENFFKYCEFEGFSVNGGVISSDFVGCTFKNVDWYWGIFVQANFIGCRLIDCTFRGTSFSDARFMDCLVDGCRFVKDNLNGDCNFTGAVAYGCLVKNSEGFSASNFGPPGVMLQEG